MNEDACVIEVNGSDYYVACNVIDYIIVDNNHLINTFNSNVTAYSNYPDPTVNGSGYPRINLNSNQLATYRSSQNATQSVLNVNDYKVINRHTETDTLLFIVIIGVMVLNLFKR